MAANLYNSSIMKAEAERGKFNTSVKPHFTGIMLTTLSKSKSQYQHSFVQTREGDYNVHCLYWTGLIKKHSEKQMLCYKTMCIQHANKPWYLKATDGKPDITEWQWLQHMEPQKVQVHAIHTRSFGLMDIQRHVKEKAVAWRSLREK